MRLIKVLVNAVIGYLIDPLGDHLIDGGGDVLVCCGPTGCYRLTAAKRDTNLLAAG
jgi:hypothetical protein